MSGALVPILDRAVGAEINAVDARQLHAALGANRDFSNWIKARVAELDLVEGADFEKLNDSASPNLASENHSGIRRPIDYALTLDAAKHIAMAERTEKGREIRSYFIECEKKLRSKVITFDPSDPRVIVAVIEAQSAKLRALESTVSTQTETIAVLAPKATALDVLTSAPETLGLREALKILQRTIAIKEDELSAFLIAKNWICRLNGRLQPAYYGGSQGYVVSIERTWTDRDGQHATPQLRITQRGLARLAAILTKSNTAA